MAPTCCCRIMCSALRTGVATGQSDQAGYKNGCSPGHLQDSPDALPDILFLHDRVSSHKLRLGLVTSITRPSRYLNPPRSNQAVAMPAARPKRCPSHEVPSRAGLMPANMEP